MKFRIVVVLIILLLIGGFIYYSLPISSNYSQSQKEQKITNLLGRKANLDDSKALGAQHYKDNYLEFNYPGDAAVYSYKDPGYASRSGTLATFSYDIKNPRVVFNYVSSKRENIRTLSDDSSFNLRKNPSRGYAEAKIDLDGTEGVEFIRDGSTESERTIFVMKDGVEYIFVYLGSDPERIDKLVKELVETVKFIR